MHGEFNKVLQALGVAPSISPHGKCGVCGDVDHGEEGQSPYEMDGGGGCGDHQSIPAVQPDSNIGDFGLVKGNVIDISKDESGKLVVSSNDVKVILPVDVTDALEEYFSRLSQETKE